jgi:hypothetical protein
MAVYIFERIDIIGGGRGKFIELIRTNWARYAELRHGVRLAGVWATVGSTAAWPEADLLWEMEDWAHFAAAQAATNPLEEKDPILNEMWREALAWRSGGHSALLIPTEFTPTVADLRAAGRSSQVVLYENIQTRPGRMAAYHAALRAELLPHLEARGIYLMGAYRHAFRPNVGVNLWLLPDWDHCAEALEPELAFLGGPAWLARCGELLEDSEGWLLAAPPAGILRT